MPIHDWSRVDAGIFHHFHQRWIAEIADVLNRGLLPGDYYALAEQQSGKFQPDVLTLREPTDPRDKPEPDGGVRLAEPAVRVRAEAELEGYRRRQNVVAVRHASGDELVAVVEIVSRGNTSSRKALDDFVGKAAELLASDVHLLILDLQPPTPRDPQGLHGALREAIAGEAYEAPEGEPLTLAAYEAAGVIRAFVEPTRVGAALIDMPLFLAPGRHVPIPLEATYRAAFDAVPRRWRAVLEPA